MVNRIANPDQHLPEYVEGYIAHPRETFYCELKPWINPVTNDYDAVKIAKACLALRNVGGGALLIGISDDGDLLDLPGGYDPEAIFSQDAVQAIVSSYSGQQFGVDVHHIQLVEPQNSRVVVIVVPGIITTPVMCKKDSRDDRDPKIKKGAIYTRTVAANGVISSAPASQQDLEDITKRCFQNRVADIGLFLRDHLTEENVSVLKNIDEVRGVDVGQDRLQMLDEFSASSAASFQIGPNIGGDD